MVGETHERLVGQLASVLVAVRTIESVPNRLCEAGRQMLSADGAAMTLSTSTGSRAVVAATDELSQQIEDLQDVVEQGPRFEALKSGTVQIADFASDGDDRWSLMHQHGAGLGFAGTMIAVPLLVDHHVIGVLSAHRQSPEAADDHDIGIFLGVALGAALLREPSLGLGGYMDAATWPSQAQVHQATGMVVAQTRVLPHDALALLKGQAFAQNSTLLDIAQQIIQRQINFRHFTIEGD